MTAPRVQETRDVSPPPLKKRKVQSTTNADDVQSFFTKTSQKPPEKTTWRTMDGSLLIAQYATAKPKASHKFAVFDLDGTIIKTASGKTFAREPTDWRFWDTMVPGQLQKLHDEGFQIAFLSNQGGLNLDTGKVKTTMKIDKKKVSDFKEKVNVVLNRLDLPITLYAATQQDHYRKPRIGMWRVLLENYDINQDRVNMKESFFVGDAAGRLSSDEHKADFGSSDRDLAANVGIKFETPEQYFLHQRPRPFKRKFDPSAYLLSKNSSPSEQARFVKQNDLEIVLFVGLPGAGKSTFYFNHLKPLGYERVNQDTLKTRDKCLKKCKQFITAGQSVVVDNTNMDKSTRAHWTDLAKTLGVPIQCIELKASPELCQHNDTVRALNTGDVSKPY